MAGSTPIYGFPYPESSDLVANYPALGQDLAEDIEGVIAAIPPGGLSMVNPTSIANSGGSASASGGQVTFTGVSSVSLNGVFTSAYENYRIVLRAFTASGSADTNMRLRASGTDNSANSYIRQYVIANAGTVSGANVTQTFLHVVFSDTISGFGDFELNRPSLAETTQYKSLGGRSDYVLINTGLHNVASAFDGFTLYPSASTITGNVRVYGYKNS